MDDITVLPEKEPFPAVRREKSAYSTIFSAGVVFWRADHGIMGE